MGGISGWDCIKKVKPEVVEGTGGKGERPRGKKYREETAGRKPGGHGRTAHARSDLPPPPGPREPSTRASLGQIGHCGPDRSAPSPASQTAPNYAAAVIPPHPAGFPPHPAGFPPRPARPVPRPGPSILAFPSQSPSSPVLRSASAFPTRCTAPQVPFPGPNPGPRPRLPSLQAQAPHPPPAQWSWHRGSGPQPLALPCRPPASHLPGGRRSTRWAVGAAKPRCAATSRCEVAASALGSEAAPGRPRSAPGRFRCAEILEGRDQPARSLKHHVLQEPRLSVLGS